jgi:hypothetical protein
VHLRRSKNFSARFTAPHERLTAAEIRHFSAPRARAGARLLGFVHPNAMKLLEVIAR